MTIKESQKFIDSLIENEKLFAFYVSIRSLMRSTYLEQYRKIKNEPHYFVDVKSNRQIRTVIQHAMNNDWHIFYRLIGILGRNIDPKHMGKLIKLLYSKQKDSHIYFKVRQLELKYRDPIGKTTSSSGFQRKCQTIAYWLYWCITEQTEDRKKMKNKNWLDFGCGNGMKTANIAQFMDIDMKNVYGCDIEHWLSYSYNYEKQGKEFPFNFINIEPNKPLPIKKDTFDIITLNMVIHHVQNLDMLFLELYRILKPGGYLYILEHDAWQDSDRLLIDIEHGYYEVGRRSNKTFTNDYYCRCFEFVELSLVMNYYRFSYVKGAMFDTGIKKNITPSRSHFQIYRK